MITSRTRVAAATLCMLLGLAACGGSSGDDNADAVGGTTTTLVPVDRVGFNGGKPDVAVPDGDPPSELGITDIVSGDGDPATEGSDVEVHYVGVLHKDGTEFDSSWDRGRTFQFRVGGGNVIPGWDQGLVGMKSGGRRQLAIPSELAYGPNGFGPIGPDEALVFVVDLVSVRLPDPNALTALEIDDTEEGEGDPVKAGDNIAVHYRGFTIADDREFDNSYDRGEPLNIPVGVGAVIRGWDEGLLGMKVGGKRTLLIPADLAYGMVGQAQAGIPPNADLRFEVELIELEPAVADPGAPADPDESDGSEDDGEADDPAPDTTVPADEDDG